jgi:VCBS repeat-containing protein
MECNTFLVDWLFVRKWCGSEPIATLGSEESLNIPPVASNDSYTTDEDTTLAVAAPGVLANDSDGNADPLTVVPVSGPAHGILSLNADGSFTYAPDANYNGPDSFTYKANDSRVDSNIATVSITITPVNDAPVLDDCDKRQETLLAHTWPPI